MTNNKHQKFCDEYLQKYRLNPTPLCIGLDPHLQLIPNAFRRGSMEPDDPATVDVVTSFLTSVIDLAKENVHVVKPQAAFFEQFGWRGCKCLEEVSEYAKSQGLLVILDAKRGDIGSTADAYASAYLNPKAPFDALTVNPYLGEESITPFVKASISSGKSIFVLVKTSNKGSKDFQDKTVGNKPLFNFVADAINSQIAKYETGVEDWSSIGAVVGATHPEEAKSIRKLLKNSLFLVPGYGAQGGSARDAVSSFIDLGHGVLEGGIINSSRGILFPGDIKVSLKDWRELVSEAIATSNHELKQAVDIE